MSYKVVRLAHAGKRNRYLAATGIAFIGYVLFLSSALWFPGQKKSMEYTPLGIQQEIGETTCMVSVVYWAYAPEQEAMLVELDLDGIRSEVTFYAVDKARDPIPVEVKLAQSGTYVLKLSSVPEDFQAISLRVMVEGQTRRLYTNIDQVEQVNRLHFYPDLTGYYQARIQRNIEVLEQEIAAEKAQIQELDEQIAAYQVQITQTSERMPYLSRQQRTDAENSIETWKKEIAECQEKQQAATEQITELVDEQEKQKQLLESSELEDFERQSEPASVSESDTKEQESEETK